MAIDTEPASKRRPVLDFRKLDLQLMIAGDELYRQLLVMDLNPEEKDQPWPRVLWAKSRNVKPAASSQYLARAEKAAESDILRALESTKPGLVAARYLILGFIREQKADFVQAAQAYGEVSSKTKAVIEERRGNERLSMGTPTLGVSAIEMLFRQALCEACAGDSSALDGINNLHDQLQAAAKALSYERSLLFCLSADLRVATYLRRLDSRYALKYERQVQRAFTEDPGLQARLLAWPDIILADDNFKQAQHFGPDTF